MMMMMMMMMINTDTKRDRHRLLTCRCSIACVIRVVGLGLLIRAENADRLGHGEAHRTGGWTCRCRTSSSSSSLYCSCRHRLREIELLRNLQKRQQRVDRTLAAESGGFQHGDQVGLQALGCTITQNYQYVSGKGAKVPTVSLQVSQVTTGVSTTWNKQTSHLNTIQQCCMAEREA